MADCCALGSMVVVICRPSVLRSCSLTPDAASSRSTCVRMRPSGPGASPESAAGAEGSTAGNAMDWRSAGGSADIDTMPSST